VKTGTVKVIITLGELGKKIPIPDGVRDSYLGKAYETWNQTELPANYDRVRLGHVSIDSQ